MPSELKCFYVIKLKGNKNNLIGTSRPKLIFLFNYLPPVKFTSQLYSFTRVMNSCSEAPRITKIYEKKFEASKIKNTVFLRNK